MSDIDKFDAAHASHATDATQDTIFGIICLGVLIACFYACVTTMQ